jgi:hypothetical protein
MFKIEINGLWVEVEGIEDALAVVATGIFLNNAQEGLGDEPVDFKGAKQRASLMLKLTIQNGSTQEFSGVSVRAYK